MGVQRRARTPALHCGHKQVPARQRQPSARPANGPMQRGGGRSAREPPPDAGTPPAVPGSATLLPCIVGRAFTPAGGALRQPGRILARSCAAPPPPSLTRCHLPLQGRLYRRQSPKSLPCKGRWMRRKAQTEGCIAAWRWRYPAKPGRPLPSIRRGRCLHRPGNPAMPQSPLRRAKSPALHCGRERAATDTRQPTARPANGPMKIIGPYAGVRRPVSAGNRPTPGHRLPVPGSATLLPCIVGRGVHARRGGLRQA